MDMQLEEVRSRMMNASMERLKMEVDAKLSLMRDIYTPHVPYFSDAYTDEGVDVSEDEAIVRRILERRGVDNVVEDVKRIMSDSPTRRAMREDDMEASVGGRKPMGGYALPYAEALLGDVPQEVVRCLISSDVFVEAMVSESSILSHDAHVLQVCVQGVMSTKYFSLLGLSPKAATQSHKSTLNG